MASQKKNEVAKVTPGAVATVGGEQLPAYLKGQEYAGSGLQGLSAEDFLIPRVILLQSTSKQVEAFETAKVGKLWLGTIDLLLGDSIDFIVCSNRKRYMLLAPMEDGKGILARAEDGKTWVPPTGEWSIKIKDRKEPVRWKITDPDVKKSGLAEFGTKIPGDPESNPAATEFHDYLIYLPEHPELSPCLLSLARSQRKKARDLNGKIEFRRQPMFAQRFRMTVINDKNKVGQEFKNLAFAYNGWATEEEYQKCEGIGQRFKTYRPADEEDQAREEGGDSTGPVERGNL